jgi:hypothetical protein
VGVAFDGYGYYAPAAGGYFLDVRERLFVLQDAGWVGGIFGGDADYGEGFVDEGVGAVQNSSLSRATFVILRLKIGDQIELAVDAVWLEPVSARISLRTGKIAANFSVFRPIFGPSSRT